MSEVVNFEVKNENYKSICTLAVSAFWNCPPENYEELCSDGDWQFCWVHGVHTWAGKGRYAITTYTTINDIKKEIKNNKYCNSFNDAANKDIISIRDHDGHEWNFDCPRKIITQVVKMLVLNHSGALIKFLIKRGTLDLAFAIHLAKLSVIFSETAAARKKVESDYGRLTSRLLYVVDEKYRWQTNTAGTEYIINPEYTAAQRNKKYRDLVKCYKRDINSVIRKHRSKIAALRREEKLQNLKVI